LRTTHHLAPGSTVGTSPPRVVAMIAIGAVGPTVPDGPCSNASSAGAIWVEPASPCVAPHKGRLRAVCSHLALRALRPVRWVRRANGPRGA
jgi:hypothetical protein